MNLLPLIGWAGCILLALAWAPGRTTSAEKRDRDYIISSVYVAAAMVIAFSG